jgi:apolipoprotein D and lipocalin family protein
MSNTSHFSRSWLAAGAMALMTSGAAMAATVPALESVPAIDLERYKGQWYQIALYPNSFQKQCVSNTTATYTKLADGSIEVLNQCKTADGSISKAVGNARVKQPRATLANPKPLPASTSRLEVRFAPKWLAWAPAVWAPYWVIQLADDYRYAVVGEPTRKFLWILSRTPTLDPQDEAQIMGRLPLQGYDPSKLRPEPQPQ